MKYLKVSLISLIPEMLFVNTYYDVPLFSIQTKIVIRDENLKRAGVASILNHLYLEVKK